MEDFIGIHEIDAAAMARILALAGEMKLHPERFRHAMDGRTLALLFEKPSLRTRTTFEVAMNKMGGKALYLAPSDIGLGKRESIADVARNFERWVDVITARTFAHSTVTELAKWAGIPVINALTDLLHPCQALADYMTLEEHLGDLKGKTLCYVGDGNNVAHSLMLGGSRMGMNVTVLTPPNFGPDPRFLELAQAEATRVGSEVIHSTDLDAVTGANAVYTDVWASMGQEEEAAERDRIFRPYQVNGEMMAKAAEGALFLHCLPAHRGDEVTDEIADGPTSVIFDEAENRLWAQMAVLHTLVHGD